MLRQRHRPSSCRDRTREFRAACGAAGGHVPLVSEFRRRAAGVGYGISEASRKIAHLAQLAKSTSVFDDPTVDIQNLTAAINKEITALKAAVLDLQIFFNSQNEGGNISRDATNHSTAVVDMLKEDLTNAAKEFNEVLNTRKKSLRVHQDRRNIFTSSTSGDGSNPSVRQDQPSESIPPAPWAIDSASNSLFQRQRNSSDVSLASGLQQQQLAVQQDSYTQSRAEAIHNLESTAHDLSQIFTQLSNMVSQQGELAIRLFLFLTTFFCLNS
ncbi:Syntaxin-32 [Dichanthelium oligosanthes]|uniref:Syntaxin-32 n=1 Tax=Dichanthelium oligosanthes TaxID=888268 RepID=A0A1E5UP95_9POAL|nr:Syntaxin-32 [Dichanthelium oligosanthes]